MSQRTKLVVAGLTLGLGLFALVEASSGAPPRPKPVVHVPKLAPLRPAGALPHRVNVTVPPTDAGAPPTDAGTTPNKASAVLSPAQKSAFVAKVNGLRA